MIVIKQSGNFKNTEGFFGRILRSDYYHILERYGRDGVNALSSATPIDSGETAKSWDYKVIRFKGGAKIIWTNSNVVDGVPIATLIQYGHGTKNGGFVQGRDYINPALRPIFDKLASDVWKEVTA